MRRSSLLALLALLLPRVALAAGEEQLVVPLVHVSGVPDTAAPVVTELVLEALLTRHGVHALGPSDLRDLLTVEQQKQLVGCDDSRCMNELGGALGASRLVTGLIGRLGDTFVLTVRVVDTSSAQVIGRASRKMARLEDAPEVVGPLVDELLGRAPRAPTEVPKLLAARKETEAKKKAGTVEAFCGAMLTRYESAVGAAESAPRLVDARRALLEDLLWTQFLTELESKLACWRARDREVEGKLRDRHLAARTVDDADRLSVALGEWSEARENARLLVEAYRTGLEKEKLGTGARPLELPFALRPARAAVRETSAELARFNQAWDAARPTITEALAAAAASDKARFVERFLAKGAPRRAAPRDLYVETLSRAEHATLDACPWLVLDATELARRARAFAETGRVLACIRSVHEKDAAVTLLDVELAQDGGAWRIWDWPTAKPAR